MRIPRVLHTETVTIIQTTAGGNTDADGVATRSAPVETPWPGVNVQQTTADEDLTDNRDLTVTIFRVSGPPPAVTLGPTDRIRRDGVEHEIVGDPDTRTGRHRINHTSLLMRRARG